MKAGEKVCDHAIDALSDALWESVAEIPDLFRPVQEVREHPRFLPVFRPLLDPERGQLGTDFLQRLGDILRRDPRQLVQYIQPGLEVLGLGSWKEEQGFLNLQLSNAGAAKFSPLRGEPRVYAIFPREYKILVAPNDDFFTSLRLRALAALQARCVQHSGRQAVIRTMNGEYKDDFYTALISDATQAVAANPAEIAEWIRKEAETDSGVTVWLSASTMPRPAFDALHRQTFAGSRFRELKCPQRSYLSGASAALDLRSWTPTDQRALFWYLCGPAPAAEIDLGVPRLRERENTWGLLGELIERIETHSSACTVSRGPSASLGMTAGGGTFPLFPLHAGLFGEVQEFMMGVRNLLEKVLRIVNDPGSGWNLDTHSFMENSLVENMDVLRNLRTL